VVGCTCNNRATVRRAPVATHNMNAKIPNTPTGAHAQAKAGQAAKQELGRYTANNTSREQHRGCTQDKVQAETE
jgi:hypothetical protein